MLTSLGWRWRVQNHPCLRTTALPHGSCIFNFLGGWKGKRGGEGVFLKDRGCASQPAQLAFVVAAGHPFPLPWGLIGAQTPSPLDALYPTGCSSSVSLTGPPDWPLHGVSAGRPGAARLLPSLRVYSPCGELLSLPCFESRLTPHSVVHRPELYRGRSPPLCALPQRGRGVLTIWPG